MTEENRDGMGQTPDRRPWRLGVLLSGSGRTLENLLAVIAAIAGVVAKVRLEIVRVTEPETGNETGNTDETRP